MMVFRQFWLHWTVAGNVNYADQIKRNIKIGIAVHCHCRSPGQIILLCWKVLTGLAVTELDTKMRAVMSLLGSCWKLLCSSPVL